MLFSKKLHQLRKKNGLTQEKLAESLGVSRQSVSKWESGQSFPETDKLIKLSNIFNVTLDDLIKEGELKKYKKLDIKNDNEEDREESLIIGGFIVGIAMGFITQNFMWGIMGGIIGLGVGHVICGIKK